MWSCAIPRPKVVQSVPCSAQESQLHWGCKQRTSLLNCGILNSTGVGPRVPLRSFAAATAAAARDCGKRLEGALVVGGGAGRWHSTAHARLRQWRRPWSDSLPRSRHRHPLPHAARGLRDTGSRRCFSPTAGELTFGSLINTSEGGSRRLADSRQLHRGLSLINTHAATVSIGPLGDLRSSTHEHRN